MGCVKLHILDEYYKKPELKIRFNNKNLTFDFCKKNARKIKVYFYIGDHLGSASWITDYQGNPVQYLSYDPFGSQILNQKAVGSTFESDYKFNAKPLDTESGYYNYGQRMYSSDLGIFLSVDPRAEKYPFISPFAYCLNRPTMLIDPNGDTVKIAGMTYTPGMKYTGSSSFVGKVVGDLNSLYNGGDAGKGLVGGLCGSSEVISIEAGKTNGYLSNTNTVSVNHSATQGGLDQNGNSSFISNISLGHELGHALDDINGTMDNSTWYKNSAGKVISNAEKFATHIENQLRAEHGLPLRTHYVRTTTGGVWESSRILNAGTRVSTYYGTTYRSTPRILLPPLPVVKLGL